MENEAISDKFLRAHACKNLEIFADILSKKYSTVKLTAVKRKNCLKKQIPQESHNNLKIICLNHENHAKTNNYNKESNKY